MIGEKIHHYIITRLIGEGGMASVYEAMHEKLQSKVAIKVLNPMLAANSSIRQRFENEARFMAGLTHPNITRVIDYEERPDLLAIIMEFLEGEDLNVRIRQKGPMPLQEALACFTQVLDAFDYAHKKGIVHRDVKPSNIFIEPSDTVKILDFGIAKLLGATEDMTMTGTQMGTPVYMSPEQVNTDKSIDHRSDIYSLGVTLYYMLRGEPPYNTTTTSSFQIYTKIVQEPLPDLVKFPEIDKILKIATHKDRAQRFQTCKEFRQALIEAAEPKKPAPGPTRVTPVVDAEKTLIDIPEPVKKEPKLPVEQKEKKKPAGKKEKPITQTPGSKKVRTIALSALGVLGIVIFLLFKIYPSWYSQIFSSSEEMRAKAILWLDLGKAQFKKDFDQRNNDSAVYYLEQAATIDPDNQEVQYFLGYALSRANLKDSTDIPDLTFKTIGLASDAFEKTIRINPEYPDELGIHDPYAQLTTIWGKLALKYLVNSQNDSALIAFKEGKKHGAFNDVALEMARNTLNSCDEDAILFMQWDIAYYPVLYIQNIENLRTDVKPLITDFMKTNWYFNYLRQKLEVPVSFGETWFGLMVEKPWDNMQLMTVENVNTGQTFDWWLSGRLSGNGLSSVLSVRDQLMLDIITTNKFSKPIHYSAFFDFIKGVLQLNEYMHPEGLVFKLEPEPFKKYGKLQQLKLENLSYEAIKKSKIPSATLRAALDFIRSHYIAVINEYYSQGDRVNALIVKTSMEENIPFGNYPCFYKEMDSECKSLIKKLDYNDDQRLQKEKADIKEYLQKNNLNGSPTASGLYYIETQAGSGPKAMPGNTVKVHYTGNFLDGTKFDSSYDRAEPYAFNLGEGQVIKGWDEGIALMRLGSKGLLIIPYDLGYGARDHSSIPAYSTLVFEVELVEIE